jgi:hypothetical protein
MSIKKKCSKCGENKVVSDFSKCSKNKDGLRQYCKCCAKEYNKEYRKNNKEKIREQKSSTRIQIANEYFNINTAPEELKPAIAASIAVRKLSKTIKKIEDHKDT